MITTIIPLMSRRTALAGLGAGILSAVLRGGTGFAQDATPAPSGGEGLASQLLWSGTPGSTPGLDLALRHDVLGPGSRVSDHTHPGAVVLLVEAGTLGYTPLDGTARLIQAPLPLEANHEWDRYADVPLMRAPGVRTPPEVLATGTEVLLSPGDWLFGDAPRADLRNAGQDTVVLLVAGLTRVD